MIDVKFSNYGEFNQNLKIGPSKWANFDLICIHKGAVAIELDRENKEIIEENSAILIFPNTFFSGKSLHKQTYASVHHFNLNGRKEFISSHPLADITSPHINYSLSSRNFLKHVDIYIDQLITIFNDKEGVYQDLMMSSIINIILCNFKIKSGFSFLGPYSHQFSLLDKWLRDNISHNISVCKMAKFCKVSESHFRVLFKKSAGIGPLTYFNKLKMQKACSLLKKTKLPIRDIALLTGYHIQAHFYRVFKKHINDSPKKYRDKFQLKERYL